MGLNALARLGLELEPGSFVDVREARLKYQEQSYSIQGNPVFRIIRRERFDHWLLGQARSLGASIYEGEAVESIERETGALQVRTGQRTFRARVVVAADGSSSAVRRLLRWRDGTRVARLIEVLTPEPATRRAAFRDGVAVLDFTPMTSHRLQGYYWDFPSWRGGDALMNRGVFDSRVHSERPRGSLPLALRDLMAARGRRLSDFPIQGHPVRCWSRQARFAIPRVLLVGDAAGVDPLFGEGIAFALGYGKVAADVVARAFRLGDFSLADYRERLLADPMFEQLDRRARLARLAYAIHSPSLLRLGWKMAGVLVRGTPWNDPSHVPIEPAWSYAPHPSNF